MGNITTTIETEDIAMESNINNTSNPSSPKMNTNTKLTSTFALNRQYSSPSLLDSSPKTKISTTKEMSISTPPITASINLTPIIRNTNNTQVNDPTSTRTASLISPEAEADLRNMSIPLLSSKAHADVQSHAMPQLGHDEILLTRIPRSFTNSYQYNCKLTSLKVNSNNQYQPSRDNSFTDIGRIQSAEDLSIFIDDHDPLPLEDRQLSIPSIRIANHLGDSAASASYTSSCGIIMQCSRHIDRHTRYYNDYT